MASQGTPMTSGQPRVPRVPRGLIIDQNPQRGLGHPVIRISRADGEPEIEYEVGAVWGRDYSQQPNSSNPPFKDPAPALKATQARPDPRASPFPSCPLHLLLCWGPNPTQRRAGEQGGVLAGDKQGDCQTDSSSWGDLLRREGEDHGWGVGSTLRKQRVRCMDPQ